MLRDLREALALLPAGMRARWVGLAPLMVVSTLLELLGAGIIYTWIRHVNDPDGDHHVPLNVLDDLGAGTRLLWLSAAVAIFYVSKNALVLVQTYLVQRLAHEATLKVSVALLQRYLRADSAFLFRRNSATLIRTLRESVEIVYPTVALSAVEVLAECCVLLAVTSFLVLVAPVQAVVGCAVAAVLLVVTLRLTQIRVGGWGAELHDASGDAMKTAQQALNGAKEVKLLGKETYFSEAFGAARSRMVRLMVLHGTLSVAPRLFIEAVFVCVLVVVVIALQLAGGDVRETIPLIGLVAYTGFRVLPSIQRLVYRLNSIRFGRAALEQVRADFAATAGEPVGDTPEVSFERDLVLEQVTYRYPETERAALRGVSLRLESGQWLGVIGPTGGGKSTMMDILLGVLRPSEGTFSVDGSTLADNPRGWQEQLGYVPQEIFLLDDSVQRNVAFGERDDEVDPERLRKAIDRAQLRALVEELPDGLDTVLGERGVRLSGGERQRIAFARAIYREPRVVLLDEATNALDRQTERAVLGALREPPYQPTVVFITHRASALRDCAQIVILDRGEIVARGSHDELAKQPLFREFGPQLEPD